MSNDPLKAMSSAITKLAETQHALGDMITIICSALPTELPASATRIANTLSETLASETTPPTASFEKIARHVLRVLEAAHNPDPTSPEALRATFRVIPADDS